MSPSSRLNIAHFYQEEGIKFHEPLAAQIHIYHTMQGLQRAGHQVSLLALQGRQVLFTPDLQVFKSNERSTIHFSQTGWSGTTLFKRFESGVRRLQNVLHIPYLALFDSYRMAQAGYINLKGYDLIHERFNLLALGGAWASKKLGIPFVLEVNADLLEQRKFKGIQERGLRRLFAIWATRVCFNTATQIICISPRLKEHLHTKWNINERKLTVLPCAADVEAFKPNYNSETVRKSLGLTTEPVVMWVGGFYPWHNLSLLLESFELILKRRADAKLVLVGDGQTRSAVEDMITRDGLHHAVILTGKIAHSQVPEMLSIADVAVVPSPLITARFGGTGTPLKLFEYMAAGKAIVATALDEAAEVIQDGYNGVLVEAGDVNTFAEATLKLINDPKERIRLGQNAREQTVKQYSWEHYTRRLEEIYLSAVGNSSSGSPAVNASVDSE